MLHKLSLRSPITEETYCIKFLVKLTIKAEEKIIFYQQVFKKNCKANVNEKVNSLLNPKVLLNSLNLSLHPS